MELNNFMFEKWMLIDGYINYYVSNFGRVINMTTKQILKPSITSNGYKSVALYSRVKKVFAVHRLVAFAFIDNYEKDRKNVDHKNHNKLDNNVNNLRWATTTENGQNRKKQKNTKSIYKGVIWRKDRKVWVAKIMYNKHRIYLGSYKTQEEAGRAYNEKAIELFGEFAKLNTFELNVA